MQTGTDIFPEQREVFTEIEAVFEYLNSCMAQEHFGGRGSLLQPVRQNRFSGGGSRGIQKLEDGAMTEYVEVICVRVLRIAKARAIVADAGPFAFEPGKCLLVVNDGSPLRP